MRALRTITMVRNGSAYHGWVPSRPLNEISVRFRRSSFKPVPWLCFEGLADHVEIPQTAKRLHVTIHKEEPKSGAWFAIEMPSENWAPSIVLTDLDIGGGLSWGTEVFLKMIMQRHKLTKCYALLEWS